MIELTLVSANTKRMMDAQYYEQQEKEREIQRLACEKAKEESVGKLFNFIKKDLMESHGTVFVTIYEKDFEELYSHKIYCCHEVLQETFDKVKELYALAGYELDIYFYSSSWFQRSGKFAQISVHY